MKALGSLDLFLLALMERGLATPYDFLTQAGLSVGATAPALRRLRRAGLVARGAKESPRQKQQFALTAKGRRELARGWRQALEGKIPTDAEGVLRLAALALAQSGQPRIAADFLRRAARAKEEQAADDLGRAEPTSSWPSELGSILLMMKALVDDDRHRSEIRTLRRIARRITRPKQAK